MLISLLVVLIIIALAFYLIQLLPIDGRLTLALQVIVIVIAIIFLLRFVGGTA